MSGIFGESAGRRRYRLGRRCEDCGRESRPTTLVYFWSSGMPYYVCSDCIRPYRSAIMHPGPAWQLGGRDAN